MVIHHRIPLWVLMPGEYELVIEGSRLMDEELDNIISPEIESYRATQSKNRLREDYDSAIKLADDLEKRSKKLLGKLEYNHRNL